MERDVSSWSSECLHQLLLGVRVEGPEGVCQLTEVTKLEGEASINNRKGKLFYFYEWQLRLRWLGMSCRGVKFRGTIDVSNLSDENDEDDLDICMALCKDQPNTPLLDLMKTSGVQEVRRVLGEYVRRLKSVEVAWPAPDVDVACVDMAWLAPDANVAWPAPGVNVAEKVVPDPVVLMVAMVTGQAPRTLQLQRCDAGQAPWTSQLQRRDAPYGHIALPYSLDPPAAETRCCTGSLDPPAAET
ncbi:unnamed protein product [Oreochromis niloticus]|nr:unnamed protein product [Mustela putorius furo]